MATLMVMKDAKEMRDLSPIARRAWKRLESDFPSWAEHLDIRDGELEFAVPAPPGSKADHLVVFSHNKQLWVRFSPPYLCYPVDSDDEMIAIIKQLTNDSVVFKVVMNGDEWVETTLVRPDAKPEFSPDYDIRLTSWSGKLDK